MTTKDVLRYEFIPKEKSRASVVSTIVIDSFQRTCSWKVEKARENCFKSQL